MKRFKTIRRTTTNQPLESLLQSAYMLVETRLKANSVLDHELQSIQNFAKYQNILLPFKYILVILKHI